MTADVDRLITPDDMAAQFNVPVSTLMDWHRRHKWPHVRVGKAIRWTPEQLEEILRRHTVAPDNTTLPGQTKLSAARSAS